MGEATIVVAGEVVKTGKKRVIIDDTKRSLDKKEK